MSKEFIYCYWAISSALGVLYITSFPKNKLDITIGHLLGGLVLLPGILFDLIFIGVVDLLDKHIFSKKIFGSEDE